ncbi:SpoIIE family protein phosphatase [Streptomyces sp. RFCAC02]|uniref:PP2C family protein-serine/threonine phosphatase n=1 Tax=Streptomyces sp. RFCAC02 TaxID=2499143 RepID=UPI00101F2BE4|nr:SpoIIE family protein phosphatase [Streptomyces sp. RFCAC02]
MTREVDHAALFAATPSPYLVLDTGLVIADANDAFLRATGRTRPELLGRPIFDVFPRQGDTPETDTLRALDASLRRVLDTGEPDTMVLQRYDAPDPTRPSTVVERWWSPVNTPVRDDDGSVRWIIHRVEDVTPFVEAHRSQHPEGKRLEATEFLEAELFARASELQRLNEELRRAHAREREVAVTLQRAMLDAPDLEHHRDVAVRYLPATRSLNVCGDWYDVVDLPPDRMSVAVGDVVGHGLEAAAVMGMLRSALSAATRALERPAQALEVLGLYARFVDGALGTTAVNLLIDRRSRLITYSSAGHPPSVLMHADESYELLDAATDPPLGARPQHVPRPQASLNYAPGDTLVMYTDGLIERRDEDIDTGLERLIRHLGENRGLGAAELADTLLDRLGVSGGGPDDTALIVVQL